jgi:hypothetical protein
MSSLKGYLGILVCGIVAVGTFATVLTSGPAAAAGTYEPPNSYGEIRTYDCAFYDPELSPDCDTDGDGLPDYIEWQLFGNGSGDMDGDGLSDGVNDPDTDGDALLDGWEYYKLSAYAVGDPTGDNGTFGDPDNDGLTNFQEYDYGTHPKEVDSDSDNLSDYLEFVVDGTIDYFVDVQQNPDVGGGEAFDQGWFRTYTWDWDDPCNTTLEQTVFTTPFVIEALNSVERLQGLIQGATAPALSDVIDYAVDHFYDNIETWQMGGTPEYGIWNFFGLTHHGSGGTDIPADLDDTAVIQLVLRHNNQYTDPGERVIDYGTHLNYYKDSMRAMSGTPSGNPRYGAFCTWFTTPPTDVCIATNANVLLDFLDYDSYSIEVAESIAWLNKQMAQAANSGEFDNNFMVYYRSPFAHMYMAARAYHNYGNFGSGISATDILAYILDSNSVSNAPYQSSDGEWFVYTVWPVAQIRPSGYVGNVLETAFGTCALLYMKKDQAFCDTLSQSTRNDMDEAIEDGISFILGNAIVLSGYPSGHFALWDRETFYVGGGGLAIDFGSEEATSAICLEALALYCSLVGEAPEPPGTSSPPDILGAVPNTDPADCESGGRMPQAFALSQNYPNPFKGSTSIRYALPRACHVRLEIFDARGRIVETLVDSEQASGYRMARWDAGAFPGGIYFCRLTAADVVESMKIISLK